MQKNIQNESGRSMVEMLGVLAIIGVLSVGGIAGYTTAMNSHRANEAIQNATRLAVLLSSKRLLNSSTTLSEDELAGTGFEIAEDTDKIVLSVSVSDAVKTKIEGMGLKTATLGTNNNKLTFTFKNDLSEQNPSQTGGSGQQKPETPTPECTSNSDCYAWEICDGGECKCNEDKCLDYCNNAGNTCTQAPNLAYITSPIGHDGLYCNCECLTGDTLILMADGTTKRIDQMAIGDKVISINPVTGMIAKDEVTVADSFENKTHTEYDIWTFSDGTIVKTVHPHRFYNIEQQKMVYMSEWKIGEHAYTKDGKQVSLVSHENVKEEVHHYTIFTKNWNNYFANGLLSGNRNTPDMKLGK